MAVGNLVAATTGVVLPVVNTNDPVEMAYHQVLLDDDTAEKDVLKWSDEADASSSTNAQFTLHNRIRQRLLAVKAEYENFITLHPDHPRIRLAYGSFLNDTHDEEAAVVQWEKAGELDPKNPAVWNNLANYYGHNAPVAKAFEYYGKAIELDGGQAVYYANLAMTIYLFRADAREYYHATEQQIVDKTLGLYRKALALDPDNFVLCSDYAQSFYSITPPRWEEGLAAWTQALKIARDDAEREGVYIHLARINIKLARYNEARQSLAGVTNAMYAPLKNRLSKNITEAIKKSVTSAPTD